MSFRLGLVGLCTSHPGNWVPVIRTMKEAGEADVEVVAAWDSGETRPAGFAAGFCSTMKIPHVAEHLEDMLPLVDGVIVHTTNWDRHIEQAEPFVEAGKSVFIDKPVVGNLRDAARIRAWQQAGRRISGGSALRFAGEVAAWGVDCRELHTAYSAVGTDDFNYGIHGYSLLCQAMGYGVVSARYLDFSRQKQILLKWHDGRSAILTVGKAGGLPFNITAVSASRLYQAVVDNSAIYRNLLRAQLPYLTGRTDVPPVPPEFLLEPELAAIAARESWLNQGRTVRLDELLSGEGYDGYAFAAEYRRTRLTPGG